MITATIQICEDDRRILIEALKDLLTKLNTPIGKFNSTEEEMKIEKIILSTRLLRILHKTVL